MLVSTVAGNGVPAGAVGTADPLHGRHRPPSGAPLGGVDIPTLTGPGRPRWCGPATTTTTTRGKRYRRATSPNIDRMLAWVITDPATWRELVWIILDPWTRSVLAFGPTFVIGWGIWLTVVEGLYWGLALSVAAFFLAPVALKNYALTPWPCSAPRPTPSSSGRSTGSTRSGPTRSTSRPPSSAGPNATSTTAPGPHGGRRHDDRRRRTARRHRPERSEGAACRRPGSRRRPPSRNCGSSSGASTRPCWRNAASATPSGRSPSTARSKVKVHADLLERPESPVESAVYFAVSELLASASRYASKVTIDISRRGRALRVTVSDDRPGGARGRAGRGLAGIERRLAAFDGVLALSSPPGGPTTATIEVLDALPGDEDVEPVNALPKRLARSALRSLLEPGLVAAVPAGPGRPRYADLPAHRTVVVPGPGHTASVPVAHGRDHDRARRHHAGHRHSAEPLIHQKSGRMLTDPEGRTRRRHSTLLREGLVHLLRAHEFDVVAAVESGPELLEALVTHRPDVAVVDVRLPPTFTDEGLQAALAARKQDPGLPVLVLSQHVQQLYAPRTSRRRHRRHRLPAERPRLQHRPVSSTP